MNKILVAARLSQNVTIATQQSTNRQQSRLGASKLIANIPEKNIKQGALNIYDCECISDKFYNWN